ncbi:MAG: hypothetical protein ACKV2T_03250 [Kofleriaceae bacterium]
MRAPVWIALVLAGAACEREPADRKEPEIERARRVIEPPVGIVRPLPPFLISSAGVGPYKLGDRLADILRGLPTGPRIAMYEIPSVLHRSLIRAEEGDSIRVGGEPNGTVTSVAVIDSKVARTESGIHVGSTRAELEKSGLAASEPGRAHDPRLALPASPRGARILFDPDRKKDRIAAIVVVTDAPPFTPAATEPCPRPTSTDTAFGACFTGSGPGEHVEVDGSDITIRSAESDKLIAPLRLTNDIVLAAPLRIEGRDELVVVMRDDEPQVRTWSLVAYRFEGGKMLKTADATLYSISATNARWIGVELPEIDLYLELAATNDAIEVGGLLTTTADPDTHKPGGNAWRDVVVISPVSVPRRHEKGAKAAPTSQQSGSGVAVDAGVDAAPSNP